MPAPEILYEDNHIIAVNKRSGEIVQSDETGDKTMGDDLKEYIKEKYHKEGNVFLGVVHRIDRPVSGVVIFSRTSKGLARMNELFKEKDIQKTYWAVVKNKPNKEEATLIHYHTKNEGQRKANIFPKEIPGSKRAELHYKLLASSDNYHLLEVQLMTGRFHQIRAQLAKMGFPIKGDVKYGFNKANEDASIHLHARKIEFIHPVKKEKIEIVAPVPNDPVWKFFEAYMKE